MNHIALGILFLHLILNYKQECFFLFSNNFRVHIAHAGWKDYNISIFWVTVKLLIFILLSLYFETNDNLYENETAS